MNSKSSTRNGALLVELLACGVLLGIVFSTAIPTLRWVIRQRKFTQERQAAVIEVENLMEKLTSLDWDALTPERVAEFRLSPRLADQLPEGKLEATVEADPADALAKIVTLRLAWQTATGQPPPPVHLTAWVYRRSGDAHQKETAAPQN